ncbi:hypothetical protein [Thaumasiovibrio sp. DFM-14]|uniref:hypothetical protein n=1 Tax=Thaumasiovibrio sp. DFM-14 TaxID=3384792 RepID=UPI0039A35A55
MELLERAQQLFQQPLTIDSLRELDRLTRVSIGTEAALLTSLWEVALISASEAVLEQAMDEGLL